jgi:hypothetical protein
MRLIRFLFPWLANSVDMDKAGRFDYSFVVRMIRDFFISLLLVMLLELGFRYANMIYQYRAEGQQVADQAAQNLAADVKAIMLNKGGPVASRTVYPILQRNHRDLGLEIAIQPSQVTIDSIEPKFNFTPHGLPAQWSEGEFYERTVSLQAEGFCIQCHTAARTGDVLGAVTVRNYLSAYTANWWQDAREITFVGLFNIIWHTIILYLLLKLRMEPLLKLRSVMGRLARGELTQVSKPEVKSDDEFGELTLDLNRFLDRVHRMADEFQSLCQRVNALEQSMAEVSGRLVGHVKDAESSDAELRQLLTYNLLQAVDAAAENPRAANIAFRQLSQTLRELTAMLNTMQGRFAQPLRAAADDVARLRADVAMVAAEVVQIERLIRS